MSGEEAAIRQRTGLTMTARRLAEEEVEAILAHIKMWWEPDQRQFQAEVTGQACDET